METKICNKCGLEKTLDEFEFRKDRNAYRGTCKKCRYEANKQRNHINKNANNEAASIKYQNNKDIINQKRRERYNLNKEEINKKRREKYILEKDKLNEKRRYRNHNNNDIYKKLRTQLYNAIVKSYERKGFVRTKSVEEILGRSLDEELQHLLRLYKHRYNKDYDGTEKVCIDHIIPIWTAETVEELDECNKCIQLLTEEENHRKGGKFSNGIGKDGRVKYVYYNPKWFE